MRCRYVKKLLLSGVAEGEMAPDKTRAIAAHIEACPECGEYKKVLEDAVLTPLASIEKRTPPDRVWEKIKSEIERQDTFTALDLFGDRIREFFILRKPVFAAATAATLLFAALFAGLYRDVQDRQVSDFLYEEMEFFFSLGDRDWYPEREAMMPGEEFLM